MNVQMLALFHTILLICFEQVKINSIHGKLLRKLMELIFFMLDCSTKTFEIQLKLSSVIHV